MPVAFNSERMALPPRTRQRFTTLHSPVNVPSFRRVESLRADEAAPVPSFPSGPAPFCSTTSTELETKMKRTFNLRSIVALSLLAATGLVTAADNAPNSMPETGKHAAYKRFDPVQHTQRKLDNLEAKLSLKDDQKSAWQVYADAALSRAKDRTARMQEFHGKRGEPRKDLDTATKLDKAAEMMQARAEQLQKVAQDTRSFQQVLTPEQQAIFDLYWKSQQRRGKMGGHRPA
jgi:hypothetical protein